MGKGDKKSKKGKIFKGSFGNSRRRKSAKTALNKAAQPNAIAGDEGKAKKAPRKKAEA